MWLFNLLMAVGFAQEVSRLSSQAMDLSKVQKIFVAPGLVSVIEFPQNIIEVRVGDPKSVKTLISQVSPKELTVYLNHSASQASNLIVRAEKRVFVFDIVPSKISHQDYVKLNGAYGAPSRPEIKFTSAVSLAPSEAVKPRVKVETFKKVVKVGP